MGRASVESQAKMLRVLMVGAGSRARRPLLTLAVAVGIALAAAPTLAHHSRAMFDMARNITYRGVVEEYRWQNPHSQVVITVAAGAPDPSTVGTWVVEASAIGLMTTMGWTPTMPQLALGRTLSHEYHVHRFTNCTACHR